MIEMEWRFGENLDGRARLSNTHQSSEGLQRSYRFLIDRNTVQRLPIYLVASDKDCK